MAGWIYNDSQIGSVRADGNPASVTLDVDRTTRAEIFSDFMGKAGGTLPSPFVGTKTGVSTNNSVDFVSSFANGGYRLAHSADSEAQTQRLDFGDSLLVNMSKAPIFRARLKLNIANATMSADQRVVIGLGSAYNATLNSVVTNAWFRIEGANLNITVESDDGTTDDAPTDTTIDFADNVYQIFEIDCTSLSAVKFNVYTAAGVFQGSKTLSMADLAADTLVQPIVAIQRDAGAELEVVDIDYVQVTYNRT